VSAAELAPGETVLEVGAGRGALTEALATAGAEVVAVELDELLCNSLRRRFAETPAVHVVNANVLHFPPADLLAEGDLAPPYIVVANIPYYITAPLLRHFLEAAPAPRRLVLTVQREVAETIAAHAGTLSLLSVSVQFYGTADLLFRIGREAFSPQPRVESAVVRIDVGDRPQVDVADRGLFFDVVRAGFRQPRKQLHNALSQGLWLPAGEAEPLLDEAGVHSQRRAQTLSLDEWKAVYNAYDRRRGFWQVRGAGFDPEEDGRLP
jgi:16S rRNA (adenine1518-N6/adenine1519-N6)-dimethyltransferase